MGSLDALGSKRHAFECSEGGGSYATSKVAPRACPMHVPCVHCAFGQPVTPCVLLVCRAGIQPRDCGTGPCQLCWSHVWQVRNHHAVRSARLFLNFVHAFAACLMRYLLPWSYTTIITANSLPAPHCLSSSLCSPCSYTTTGSFSRSAINNSCGAKTPLAGFVTSMIVMCVLLFLTPIFKLMPYNTMGAIIIVGESEHIPWQDYLTLSDHCGGHLS